MGELSWVEDYKRKHPLRWFWAWHWAGLMMRVRYAVDWVLDKPYWFFEGAGDDESMVLRGLRTKTPRRWTPEAVKDADARDHT